MAYRPTERTRSAAEERRQRYLDAATCLVASQGFEGAKVKAIAEQCETSVGSVYSYFDGRADLLAKVFRGAAGHELETVARAVESAGPGAPAKIDALVSTFATRALTSRQLAFSLLFEPVDPVVEAERLSYRRDYHALCERVLSAGVEAGELPRQHAGITAAAIIGAIAESLVGGLTLAPERVDPELSDDAIVAEIQQFCRRAIGAEQS